MVILVSPSYESQKHFSLLYSYTYFTFQYILKLIVTTNRLLMFIYMFDLKGKDLREEPKGIVFLSKLMLLFQYCHLCLAPAPVISVSQYGTLLNIDATCQKCKQTYTWKSQPFLLNKFPAGNLLLSYAMLCAGSSVKKVLLVFQHMNLLVYHEATYYYHQRHLLIPAIVKFWHSYQANILQSLKGKEVVLAGDGRHDSMGHSAKYGTYSIYCCTVGLILHLVVVQVNFCIHFIN